MSPFIIVVLKPSVQIGLQAIDIHIERFAKRHLIKLLQDGFVEALANAVGLRRPGLGFSMLDVVDRQVQLIVVALGLAAIFRTAIGEYAQQRQSLGLQEGQYPVIEQIRRGDRRLGGVELGKRHLGVGVHEGLLIHPAHPLEGADVKGVLRSQIAGVGRFDLAAGDISSSCLRSRAATCASVSTMPSRATFSSKARKRSRKQPKPWRSQTLRTPLGEMKIPFFLNSLLVRN